MPGSTSFLGARGLAWTPDGKSLLFCEEASPEMGRAVYRFFLETGEKQRLTSPPAGMGLGDAFPAVAPDGRTLAFARGTNTKGEIYLAPLAGGEPRALTSQGQITAGLAWAADGGSIVYSHQPAIGSAFRLSRISVSGGDPRPVAETGQNVAFPSVAPQGKRLVYERVNFDTNVWLYPLPGEERDRHPRKVVASTQMDVDPRFSPDGSRIVFGSNRTGSREIWTCDRSGANLIQLTSIGAVAGSPRWSPDGRHIAFDASPQGNWDIFVVDAQGGPPRQLTNYGGSDSRPSWSKDGRWIYFGSDRGGSPQIWKMSPDGTEPVQVTQRGAFQPFESPDGRFLYFARAPGNSVWRVPVEGGEETAVRVAPNTAVWAVGEDGLYFVEYREATAVPSKWFLRVLRTGATEPIDVMEVPPPFGATSLDIAPDGRWFAYAQSDRVESDLMLLEDFE
jgi:Tol biopolymer transport system component